MTASVAANLNVEVVILKISHRSAVGCSAWLGLYLLGKLRRKNINLLDERRLGEKL